MATTRTAVLLVAMLATRAEANNWDRLANRAQGVAWLHYELTYVHDVDDTATPANAPRFSDLVLAGARLHGFVGEGASVGYHVGLDLAAGSTLRGAGFAYDVALFPIGIGVRLGSTSMIAFGVGIGATGAIRTVDDAITMPLEMTAELGEGRVRLIGRLRAAYVAGADGRHDGSPTFPFADELDAMVGLRIGHHYHDYGFPSGNGYFVGVSYRELERARFVGLTIGHSLEIGSRRTWRTPRFRHDDDRP